MADAICRWRNGTPATVVELANSLPHEKMLISEFRNIMNNKWEGFFRTPYQLACQLGLYCEAEDGYYYPRFYHDINEDDATEYLLFWLPNYYIPNPYTGKSGFLDIKCPTYFLRELYEYTKKNPNCKYHEAYEACFHESAKNNNDIIRNYINSYSRVLNFSKEGLLSITDVKPENVFNFMDRNNRKEFFDNFDINRNKVVYYSNTFRCYITAIKSKPFLLLAGISGTGKSRIVREFAFKSCPKYLQDKNGTTPGNYCMIEVKPNWHDSTELLGYYSRLGKAGYQFTKFVKFLVKAKMFPKVPFFACLDEMNLAPVEQYFAEILSILETRKHPKATETGEVDMSTVKTESIIDACFFRELSEVSTAKNTQTGETYKNKLTDRDIYLKLFGIETEEDIDEKVGKRHDLTTEGLTLPDNVIIIGTVNMDDTTHQFSRKVIDRAMTIEMNGGNLRSMFGGSRELEYLPEGEQEKWQNAFIRRYVTADEVLEAHPEVADKLMNELPSRLETINNALKGTPFEVSYRVLNEFTIMVGVMLDENRDMELDDIINQALNNILLMKILPRIEGDAEMFDLSREYKEKMGITYNNRLEWLKELAPNIQEVSTEETREDEDDAKSSDESKEHQQIAKEKIQEMIDRLNNQEYTRFWP